MEGFKTGPLRFKKKKPMTSSARKNPPKDQTNTENKETKEKNDETVNTPEDLVFKEIEGLTEKEIAFLAKKNEYYKREIDKNMNKTYQQQIKEINSKINSRPMHFDLEGE